MKHDDRTNWCLWKPLTMLSGRFDFLSLAAVMVVLAGMLAASRQIEAQGLHKISPGDSITVTVRDQSDLSGTFMIDNGGDVVMPVIGSVRLLELTLEEAEKRITDSLADGFVKHPLVFVRLAAARPVHIFGDVRNAGTYPYNYGNVVKTVIAQAGGYASSERLASGPDLLLATERVVVLAANRDKLMIRARRIEAQLQGQRTIQLSKRLSVNDEVVQRLVGEETSLLNLQVSALEEQRYLILSQRPKLEAHNEAIDGQINAENTQAELIRQQIRTYDSLMTKGLGRNSSVIELQLALAVRESNVWRLKAERARVELAILELDAKVQDLEARHKGQLVIDLQDVHQKLFEVEVTLPSAREILAMRLQSMRYSSDGDSIPTVKIVRPLNRSASTLDASETTRIEPGDIIEVRLSGVSKATSATGSSN